MICRYMLGWKNYSIGVTLGKIVLLTVTEKLRNTSAQNKYLCLPAVFCVHLPTKFSTTYFVCTEGKLAQYLRQIY